MNALSYNAKNNVWVVDKKRLALWLRQAQPAILDKLHAMDPKLRVFKTTLAVRAMLWVTQDETIF